MEPTIIAAITGALTALATEVAKGSASEAGKDAWEKIKGLLGANSEKALEKAQAEVAKRIEADPGVVNNLLVLLKSSQSVNAAQLVGSITAGKVVVAKKVETLNM